MESINTITAASWLASACPVAGSHVQVKLRVQQPALRSAAYGPFTPVRPMTGAQLTVDDANGVVRGPQTWRQLAIT